MIQIKKNGQKCYLNGSLVPVPGKPIIDKLYITADFSPEYHEQIISNFIELYDKGYGVESKKASYKHSLKISGNLPDYDGQALLQCSPNNKKKGYNFFRLEMTPSRIDLNNLKTILDMTLPGGYAGVLMNGRVSRIDLTVDIANVSVAEVIATYPKMRMERHFGMGLKKQTKVIGSPASSKSITLYDKVQQLSAYNGKHKDTQVTLPQGKLTRLELTLKKTKMTIDGIMASPNPFKPLALVAYPGCLSVKNYDPLWTLFLNVCQDSGNKAALAHFKPADRSVFKSRLVNEGKTDWWQPGIVWEGIKTAIAELKAVKGYQPVSTKVIGNEPNIED